MRLKLAEALGSASLLRFAGNVPPRRLIFLLILILLSSLAEGLGILLLVPLIGLLNGSASAPTPLSEPALAAALASPALLLGGFVMLLITRSLLLQCQQNEAAALQRKLINDLRLSTMRAILQAEWRWLSAQRISENSAVLLTDLTRLGWGIAQIPTLVSAAISIMIYLIVSIVLSWSATLVALAFGVVTYAAAARYRRRVVALGEAIGSSNAALHRQIEETLAGAKLIKSLGKEQARIGELGEVLAQLDAQHQDVVTNTGKARTLIDASSAIFLAVLTYAALELLHVPAELLLPLIIVFARLMPLLSGAQHGMLHWLNAVPALRRVTMVIDDASASLEPKASGEPVRITKAITIDAASFTYPGAQRAVFPPLSLNLPAPGTIAITGPSGAGKSTLADLLGGLTEADSGHLLIDGMTISGPSRVQWRQSVAYVHQDAFFFDGSIADNLRLASSGASDDELHKVLASVAAHFVGDLPAGLDTRMGSRGKRFSGGERQRVALARALLASPALLILDEATSALDPESEAVIVAAIEGLRGTTTIIVISHRPIRGLTIDYHVALDLVG